VTRSGRHGGYPRYPQLPWEPCRRSGHLAAGTSA
jgi:hypothetical protein